MVEFDAALGARHDLVHKLPTPICHTQHMADSHRHPTHNKTHKESLQHHPPKPLKDSASSRKCWHILQRWCWDMGAGQGQEATLLQRLSVPPNSMELRQKWKTWSGEDRSMDVGDELFNEKRRNRSRIRIRDSRHDGDGAPSVPWRHARHAGRVHWRLGE